MIAIKIDNNLISLCMCKETGENGTVFLYPSMGLTEVIRLQLNGYAMAAGYKAVSFGNIMPPPILLFFHVLHNSTDVGHCFVLSPFRFILLETLFNIM